ncbi:hypothetical protein AALC25_18030, partial [Lachnospiraceae bacterium 29-84]
TASGARFCMDWTDASVPERVSQLPKYNISESENQYFFNPRFYHLWCKRLGTGKLRRKWL